MRDFYITARKQNIFLLFFVCLLLFSLPAAAQENRQYIPIERIDLGVKDLTLAVGETYVFPIRFEPADPSIHTLNWFTTDDTVVQVDAAEAAVTALRPGSVRVLAESFDGTASAVCMITVSGSQPKDAGLIKSGSVLLSLADEDREKIKAETLSRYISFIEESDYSEDAYNTALQRVFSVAASVVPGTEQAESDRAGAFGMAEAEPLRELNLVALQGTLEQILAFTAGNEDLQEIFGGSMKFAIEPDEAAEETAESAEKGLGMGIYTEVLTSVSTAYDLGYDGAGVTIAVIDTGLDASHPEFAGRVTAQRCFSTNYQQGAYTYRSVCSSPTSAAPDNAITRENFAHGSHVAGIAAGANGIARSANIIAIQSFSEVVWKCGAGDIKNRCSNYASTGLCCGMMMFDTDEFRAYDYLLSLTKNGTKIAAVNMSYGGEKVFSSVCDAANPTEAQYIAKMSAAGMVPVSATGNNGYTGAISSPACISNTVAVGALNAISTPKLAPYSNHSKLVDIAAPGTYIYAATYPGNGYSVMSGTSMAAPMVTGAAAILNQAIPGRTVQEYKRLLSLISPKTVSIRSAFAGKDISSRDTRFSYRTPVLNFANLSAFVPGKISIPGSAYIRGLDHGITVEFPKVPNAAGYNVAVYDGRTNAKLAPAVSVGSDATGQYTVIRISGNMLINGSPYKIALTPYSTIGGGKNYGTTLTVYGAPNAPVTGITVTPGNGSAAIRVVPNGTADGFRYNLYKAGESKRLAYADVSAVSGTVVRNAAGLTNGSLYYVTAVPYTVIGSEKCFGPVLYPVYFVPMNKPENVSIRFASSSSASVTVSADGTATGIRVLYRTPGGPLLNGCQASGFGCTVRGLNINAPYEFYVMYYRLVNGKSHYGPGTLTVYNTLPSGLGAPSNPLIAESGRNTLTFVIEKSPAAAGISVLYKEGEGGFLQACEADGNTCSRSGFNTRSNYTFYVMQYRYLSGRKVYSPGVTVSNLLTPKSLTSTEASAPNETADEIDLPALIPDYISEEDLLREEAETLIESSFTGQKTGESTEFSVPEEDLLSEESGLPEAEAPFPSGDTVFSIDEADDVEADPVSTGKSAVPDSSGSTSAAGLYRLGDDSTNTPIPGFINK